MIVGTRPANCAKSLMGVVDAIRLHLGQQVMRKKSKLLRHKSGASAAAFGREVRPGQCCAKRAALAGNFFGPSPGAGGVA